MKQVPTEGFDWLYEDRADGTRAFYRGITKSATTPPFLQCTDAEKIAWEEEHNPPQPEPEPIPEPEDIEPIAE